MQTQKMSLANIKGKLSRTEMKTLIAGGNEQQKVQKCCIGTECTPCQMIFTPCGPNATLTDC
jgi:hypothetical protein